jgi:hypothetical protein
VPDNVRDGEQGGSEVNDSISGRRSFIKSATAIGALGIAAMAPAVAEAAAGTPQSSPGDPQAPPGLKPNAMLDNRFPITFENSVPEATKVLIGYFGAISQRDLKGVAEYLHYPFASYEGTDPVVVQTVDELIAKAPASINMTTNPERYSDHDGYIKAGSYDAIDGIEVFTADPVSVNFALNYSRYGSDGKKLLKCEGIYCITNNDGKWAIQLMSTIFTPAAMEHVTYPDTIAFAKRLRMTHDLAYQVADETEVWGNVRQYGTFAGVTQDTIRIFMGGGKAGSTMDAFRVKGVKTRLQMTAEVTPESIAKGHTDFVAYRAMFPRSGVGNWGFTYGILPNSRVVHATVNKAHLFSGVARYNVFGEEGSTATELSIATYKKGRWGWLPGTFSHVTVHDCSNNVRT